MREARQRQYAQTPQKLTLFSQTTRQRGGNIVEIQSGKIGLTADRSGESARPWTFSSLALQRLQLPENLARTLAALSERSAQPTRPTSCEVHAPRRTS